MRIGHRHRGKGASARQAGDRPLDILAVARHQPAPGIEVCRSRDLPHRGHPSCYRGVAPHLRGRCLAPHALTLHPPFLHPPPHPAALPVDPPPRLHSFLLPHPPPVHLVPH